jgi:hypothetical protein
MSRPRETNSIATVRSTPFASGLNEQGEEWIQFHVRLLDFRKGHEVQSQDAFRGLIKLDG